MIESITHKSKHYIDIKSSDSGVGAIGNNFSINFNNTGFTNVGSFSDNSSVFLTPISCSFPNSWYNITTANNSIAVSGNALYTTLNSDGTQTTVVSITVGYYSILGLVAAWTSALNTACTNYRLNAGALGQLINWIVAYDVNSKIVSITVSSANFPNLANYAIQLTFQNNTKETLGFSTNGNNSFNRVLVGGAVISVNYGTLIPDLQPIDRVLIKSNLAKRTFSMRNASLNLNDTLFSFPLENNLTGNQVVWNAIDHEIFKQEISNNFQEMTIQVCDQNGALIPFVGAFTFSFIIERETVEASSKSKKALLLADYSSYALNNK